MKHTLALVLAAALTVGLVGCGARAPRTPQELEQWAKNEQERLIKKAESARERRKAALRELAYAWEAYRGGMFFTTEWLLELKAICLLAQQDWSSEVQRALWTRIKQFGDTEVLSFFKQARYSNNVVVRVADATLNVHRKLRAFVQFGDLSLKELRYIWGEVTMQAQQYIEQEWWEQ